MNIKQHQWTERFDVNGHIIKVVVKRKRCKTVSYSALVIDNKGNELVVRHINKFFPHEAQEVAYVKFVKEFC